MSDADKPNLFFRLTTFAGVVFVVTILSLVAATFGDPQAPPARFLNAHGTTLIGWEVAAILAIGLVAMALDRRQTLRQIRLSGRAGDDGRPADDRADRAEPDAAEPIRGQGE
jgi:hypothetical protein